MTSDAFMEIQKDFLSKIKHQLPSSISFVDVLSDLFETSIDSVYRRMRGETALTFDEIIKLCNHFKVTFDSLVETDYSGVTFNYATLPHTIDGFKMYLCSILQDLESYKSSGQVIIYYVAMDIPFFYLFAYPRLAAFKMYYWMKSVLNVSEYQDKKYHYDDTDKEILKIGEKLLSLYSRVESIEIWTENTVGSLRKQIEYYWEAGYFEDNQEAEYLSYQAIELINAVNHNAENGSKLSEHEIQNYRLYCSDIEIGNNCILLGKDELRRVYHTYNTFNYMVTSSNRFSKETFDWIQTIIGKSALISGVSEKLRVQFMNKLTGQFESLIKKTRLE